MRAGWLGLGVLALCAALGVASAGDSGKDPTKLPPEISRSGGVEGGVVLLWPRVIPRSEDPQTDQDAAFVQGQLRAAIARALPGKPVDVRPNPERVCPRNGCAGISLGAVFLHKDAGCGVVATVSKPGQQPQRLIAMAGALTLAADSVPFREPPETFVTVHDFDRCVDLGPSMELRMAALEAALRDAAGIVSTDSTGQPAPTRVVIGGG